MYVRIGKAVVRREANRNKAVGNCRLCGVMLVLALNLRKIQCTLADFECLSGNLGFQKIICVYSVDISYTLDCIPVISLCCLTQ